MQYLKVIPVLLAAFLLGNWFLTEVKKAKLAQKPWYAPYLTPPGLLVIFVLAITNIITFFTGLTG